MDINQLLYRPTRPTVQLPSTASTATAATAVPEQDLSAALSSAFQVGARLTARVLESQAGNQYRLEVFHPDASGGRTQVTAQSVMQLEAGRPLQLEVVDGGPPLQVRLLKTETAASPEAAVSNALRQMLPKQTDLTQVMRSLASLNSAADLDQLPPSVRNLAAAILGSLPEQSSLTDADGLQHAVNNSGLFLESKLAQQVEAELAGRTSGGRTPLAGDLKAKLLQLVDVLEGGTPPKDMAATTANSARVPNASNTPPNHSTPSNLPPATNNTAASQTARASNPPSPSVVQNLAQDLAEWVAQGAAANVPTELRLIADSLALGLLNQAEPTAAAPTSTPTTPSPASNTPANTAPPVSPQAPDTATDHSVPSRLNQNLSAWVAAGDLPTDAPDLALLLKTLANGLSQPLARAAAELPAGATPNGAAQPESPDANHAEARLTQRVARGLADWLQRGVTAFTSNTDHNGQAIAARLNSDVRQLLSAPSTNTSNQTAAPLETRLSQALNSLLQQGVPDSAPAPLRQILNTLTAGLRAALAETATEFDPKLPLSAGVETANTSPTTMADPAASNASSTPATPQPNLPAEAAAPPRDLRSTERAETEFSAPLTTGDGNAKNVGQHTEGALAKLVLNQLASLPQADGQNQVWRLDVPFVYEGRPAGVNLQFERDHYETPSDDEENNARSAEGNRYTSWSVNLELEPPALGRLGGRVSLTQGVLNAFFWSEDPTTAQLIDTYLPQLQARLEGAGLQIGHIGAAQGTGPNLSAPKPLPGGQPLLDLRA